MAGVPTSRLEYIESLLVWIHERPQMYCSLLGELDSVLYFLHLVWAKLADSEKEYELALNAAGQTPKGLLTQAERHKRTILDDASTQRVIAFWSNVNERLNIHVRTTSWHLGPSGATPPGESEEDAG